MGRLAVCFAGILIGCGVASDPPTLDGGNDAGISDAGDASAPEVDFLTRIETPADLAALTSTIGDGVKYLAPVAGRTAPEPLTEACYFQNMRRYSWHLLFLKSFSELADISYDGYLGLVLRKASRRMWGGGIEIWAGTAHPTRAELGVVSFAVYGEVNSLDVAGIIEVDRALKACAPLLSDFLVFVPDSPDQRGLLNRERAALGAAGVVSLFPEELVDQLPQVTYSSGEAYGTLRIDSSGGEYGARDVVITQTAPAALVAVAALITRDPQDERSPLALQLRAGGIPNLSVAKIDQSAWARRLEGSLVHVVAGPAGWKLEPARGSDAAVFWEAHR